MAKFKRGQMWNAYVDCDAFCITTNSYIKKNGALVMGRGIARTARDLFDKTESALDKRLGSRIKEKCDHLGVYGIIPADPENSRIVAFQVKTHFREDASISLIRNSTQKLREVATSYSDRRFDLNFPGIGNGGLNSKDVRPVIEDLPDNVNIWRFS